MRKVYLEYNPYRLKTVITVDGAVPKENSNLNVGERRLQEWIDNLPKILEDEYRSHDFEITFHGTLLDAEDVYAMQDKANKEGWHVMVNYLPAQETKDKEGAVRRIYNEIQASPFDELKTKDIKKAFENSENSEFEVSVVGTMSAGKSTFINALLGKKLMPSKNDSCTATITRIKDNDDKNHFTAKVYNEKDALIQSDAELSLEAMRKYNADPNVSEIRVEGDIPFVSAKDMSLVLVDTPGPNNARDLSHKVKTLSMLNNSSKALVLCLLDGTNSGINDEKVLLDTIAKSMNVNGKQSRDRFLFVVNKLDKFKSSEDDVEETLGKIREDLRSYGIEDANIFPVSAEAALYIRCFLSGKDVDSDDKKDANNLLEKFTDNEKPLRHLERFASSTSRDRQEIEKLLKKAKAGHDTKTEALIRCGIISVERAIQTYVEKYAKTAKIKNVADVFEKRLESARYFETLKQQINENTEKQEQIRNFIRVLNEKIGSGEEAQKFKNQINQLNCDEEFEKAAGEVLRNAQKQVREQILPSKTRLSKQEAETFSNKFLAYAEKAQPSFIADLNGLMEENIYKNANELVAAYREKLLSFASDAAEKMDEISFDPVSFAGGELPTDADISSYIAEATREEDFDNGEYLERKWYKPWTWFYKFGFRWKSHWETREYIDAEEFYNSLVSPFFDNLRDNTTLAIEYTKKQTERIKQYFDKQFDELDQALKKKLQELSDYKADAKNAERAIADSEQKKKWLEGIQKDMNRILNI